MNLNQLRNAIVGVFLTAGVAVTGVILFPDAPAPHTGTTDNLHAPCIVDQCVACIQPSVTECSRLLRNGGEPAYDVTLDGSQEPYNGAAGKLGRVLRNGIDQGIMESFHTSPVDPVAGTCLTTVFLSREQRKAWRQTVDVTGVGSEVVDCRKATLGKRYVVLAGTDPDAAEAEDPADDTAQ